ncbi:sigma-54 dependent transcriptional regulator [Syntrophotalea acetylenica]|uniref:sigma-54-dependent transcriptional regulator n=1 Tax=Syntrophotalea acetylenica TaxID=29542 RepID=UPI000A9C55DB|nr:sigma-54 dependent transcriptional regulator [Syntrophotalea acetylenica]
MKILIVDDEEHILLSTKSVLSFAGIQDVKTIEDSRLVMPILASEIIDLIILDLFMPYMSGKDLLNAISQNYPHIPIIVMTAADEVETAVECMKAGAFDYLVKPVENTRLTTSVKRTIEIHSLKYQVMQLQEHLLGNTIKNPSAFDPIITASPKMSSLFQYCEAIAESGQPVTVIGATGVGKELVAKAIHDVSGLGGNFVAVNVAGLDDHMFSDTLFGHRKGAFTGADQTRRGLIAQATGGTLFLDEIGDLSETSQIKLLRLLQEQEYYQVGSDIPQISDARIIAATNKDLRKMVEKGTFRNDLYFRLCTHQVQIPPLRDRLEDIPLLLEHFLDKAAKTMKKKKPSYPAELITLLSSYDFPGNVRELKALVFDTVARHNNGMLSLKRFRELVGNQPSPPASTPFKTKLWSIHCRGDCSDCQKSAR